MPWWLVFVGTIAGGGGVAATAAASLLGVRNAIYGAQLNPVFAPSGWHKLLMAHLTIDESVATTAA